MVDLCKDCFQMVLAELVECRKLVKSIRQTKSRLMLPERRLASASACADVHAGHEVWMARPAEDALAI